MDNPLNNASGWITITANGTTYRVHSFIAIPLNEIGETRHDTVEDETRGFEKGSLWPYLMNPEIFHCPVDKRHLKPPVSAAASAVASAVGGYRSYSLGAPLSAGGYNETGTAENKATIIKYSEFSNPGTKVTFLEETDQSGDNDNYWNMYLGTRQWWDPFAIVHNGSSTFAYADGHADRHKWTDQNMIKMAKGELGKNQAADPLSDDYDWFRRAYIPGHYRN